MGKRIIAEPFDKFWIDCQTNNALTLLTSANSNLNLVDMMMDFWYKQGGRSGWFKVPIVEYGNLFRSAFSPIKQKKYIFEKDDIVQELIRRVDEKRVLSIEVDLYYWNPHNILYHSNHLNHLSMLVGYDSDRRELYFNDAEKGEKFLVKTYEDFLEAVVLYDGKPNVVENVLEEEIGIRNYVYDEIRKKARKLINNITAMRYQTYISTYLQPEFIHIHVNNALKMYNRHVVNEYIVRVLHSDGYIDDEAYSELAKIGNDISKQWMLIKNKLVRMSLSNKPFKFEMMNKDIDEVWEKEQKFWEMIATDYVFTEDREENCNNMITYFEDKQLLKKCEVELALISNSCIDLEYIEKKSVDKPFDVLRYFMTVKLVFNNVCGELKYDGEDIPFVIYSDSEAYTEANYVKSYSIEGNTVILNTEVPICDIGTNDVFKLCTKSDCKVCDLEGNQIPGFKHMRLGGYKVETPYINIVQQSPVIMLEDNIADYPIYDLDTPFTTVLYYDYMIPLTAEQVNFGEKETAVYNRFFFQSEKEVRMRAIFGYQAQTKIWINAEEAGILSEKNSAPPENEYIVEFTAKRGINEIVVLTGSAGGKSLGVVIKLQKKVEKELRGLDEVYEYSLPTALLYEK